MTVLALNCCRRNQGFTHIYAKLHVFVFVFCEGAPSFCDGCFLAGWLSFLAYKKYCLTAAHCCLVVSQNLLAMMWKSNTPFLFQLPHAWLVAFLSEWLDMSTVGMLDTAMSTKKHRSQFLNGLQSMRSSSIDNFSNRLFVRKIGELTRWWWQWLSIRQIYVESICLRAIGFGHTIDTKFEDWEL
jgi:hypothetical protein